MKTDRIEQNPVLGQEQGNTVVIFMVILTVLATIAMGALKLATLNVETTSALKRSRQAFYFAEVGLDLAINDIMDEFEDLSVYTESADYPGADSDGYMTQSNYRGYDVTYKITNPVDKFLYQTIVGNTIIYHYAYTYNIEGNSASLEDASSETLNEQIRILETPLVQFYIFYGGSGNAADLEILPGPTMNSWGRIHSNGDIYIGTNNSFNLRNYDNDSNLSPHSITAAGNIYLNRKDTSTSYSSGHVWVKTSNSGTTFSPKEDIQGDITSSNEASEESRFGDYVLVNEQAYQAPGKTQFVRGGFYETRAEDPSRTDVHGIKIVGTGGLGSGITVSVSRPAANTDVTQLVLDGESSTGNPVAGLPSAIVRESTSFHQDCRESDRNVDTTDIDLYALGLWYEAYLADIGDSLNDGDGILVYASRSPDSSFTNSSGNLQAIRLMKMDSTSAAQLSEETTIATDNPVYIQGDFNTISTKGVAIVADAINILSNAYGTNQNTGKTCNGGLTNASETTIYAALFGGNVPTPSGGGTYSGGLENYPRFHEKWSGKDCNIIGSFINLWTSSQADGSWAYGGDRYQAPGREWGWDVRFQDPDFWPPFIPSIYSVERVGFLE